MSILKQFEPLTKDEILLLCECLTQSIKIGKERVDSFNQTYELYKDKDISLIMEPDYLEKGKIYFDNYAEKIKQFEIILNKIQTFEDILKDG